MKFTIDDFQKGQWVVYWDSWKWLCAEVLAVGKTVKINGRYCSYTLLEPKRVTIICHTEEEGLEVSQQLRDLREYHNTNHINPLKQLVQEAMDERKAATDKMIDAINKEMHT
jgi:hypothetical protein